MISRPELLETLTIAIRGTKPAPRVRDGNQMMVDVIVTTATTTGQCCTRTSVATMRQSPQRTKSTSVITPPEPERAWATGASCPQSPKRPSWVLSLHLQTAEPSPKASECLLASNGPVELFRGTWVCASPLAVLQVDAFGPGLKATWPQVHSDVRPESR